MMKQLLIMACLSVGFGMWGTSAQQKEFKEVIKKQVPLGNSSGNSLVVKNVFGSITVEGYNGSEIIVEVEKTITADTMEDLELGKKEVQLKILQNADRVVLHPDAPYMQFDEEKLRYNWCNNNDDVPYEHMMNFTF